MKTENENLNDNVVESLASSTISIKVGDKYVNGSKLNFINGSGKAKIYAKNNSAKAVMGVHIMETAFWDDPVKEWFLQPGATLNLSNVTVPKDYLYLRLSSYSQNATGVGTLTVL